jgi:hypothetical protein
VNCKDKIHLNIRNSQHPILKTIDLERNIRVKKAKENQETQAEERR